jgi:hypothetical protein
MATEKALQFSDGNVEIRFSTTDEKYVLHSHVLALHSPWFKACLSERWSPGSDSTTANGKNAWEFELRFDKGSELGMLSRKSSAENSTTLSSSLVLTEKSPKEEVGHVELPGQQRLCTTLVCP